MVEISPDQKHMRTRDEPNKWSLAGVEPTTFSSLDASVPEFVPGKVFRPPATQSNVADDEQPQTSDKGPDSASEVSSRLEEMSVSVVTAAEPAVSEGASAVNEVDNADAEVQPDDSTASCQENEDAASERLHTPPDDEEHGKRPCLLVKSLQCFDTVG